VALLTGLAAMQRADIVAELNQRIEQGSPAEASLAVRQLGGMSRPPIDVLVRAAAANDRLIAEEAQLAINNVLRRAQRDLDRNKRVRVVAGQLAELAECLATQHEEFRIVDEQWLAATTRKILRLANRCSASNASFVAMHCDAILATTSTARTATTPTISGAAIAKPEPMALPLPEEEEEPRRNPSHVQLDPKLQTHASESPDRDADVPAYLPTDRADASRQSADNSIGIPHDESRIPAFDLHPTVPSTEPDELTNRSEWSQPVFRILSNAPLRDRNNVLRNQSVPGMGEVPAHHAEKGDDLLANLASRELLSRWLAADRAEGASLKKELVRRGFASASKPLVTELLSNNPRDRRDLVDKVIASPGVDPRPWLLALADDVDADVRLAAVTIMATSSDSELLEKAWQVAIRDPDERVAELAGRIRERRNEAYRR
jgi:hypothetical protein